MNQFYNTQEEIPEAFRSFYAKQADGRWKFQGFADGDGDGPTTPDNALKNKLDEFRENNRRLMKEQKELRDALASFDGIDPAVVKKHKEAIAKVAQEEERNLLEAGRFDDVVSRRMAAAKAAHEVEIKALATARSDAEKKAEAYRQQLGVLQIDTRIAEAINDLKLRPRARAESYIRSRGRQTWQLDEEGKPKPIGPDGEVIYGKDGSPLGFQEFVSRLAVEDSFLFEPSEGGGAIGGSKGGAGTGKPKLVPNTPESFAKYQKEIAAGTVMVDMGEGSV